MATKLVLLTGFLGAGKTTLLNHILEEYREEKVGLVVNEFSSTGVDGALIRRDLDGIQMQELTNGSIFCACIKDTFVDALIAMEQQELDYVFVEASGLADPSSITDILMQIHKLTGVSYAYQGAVCMVDAVVFPKLEKVLVALKRQVAYSRAVIINKADLVTGEQLLQVEALLETIHPGVAKYCTSYAKVSMREILGEETYTPPQAQESTNTVETKPVAVAIITEEALSLERLKELLGILGPITYRVKGFCLTTQGVQCVSMVGEQCEITSWSDPVEQTKLVIISSIGVSIVSKVLDATKTIYDNPVSMKF